MLALAGCGGGTSHTDTSRTATVAAVSPLPTQPPLPYRWLVPTQGPPPSIARENLAHGTTAWRLPGPRELLGGEAHGAVEGYAARQAVLPGETQRIYVNAPGAREVAVSVYRMGWYHGRGGRLVLQSRLLPAVRQPGCTHRATTGLTECRWHPTLSFVIPPSLPSGVYIV